MTLQELLKHVAEFGRKSGGRNRIITSDRYLQTLAKCSGGLCPTDKARYQGPEFAKRLKEAAGKLVYRNDGMHTIGWGKAPEKAADDAAPGAKFLATFDAVYTSLKRDRDSDVLHPEGGEVDPKMPLLWQHDPTLPIGRHLELLGRDKSKILGRSAIADTPLGNDAAYLAELECLRISHGFRPKEFEPITEKSVSTEMITGFDVTKYEMMEVSLVSVPSNTDAVIQGFHRNKFASPVAKSWGKSLDEHRQRFFTTGFGVRAIRPKNTVVGVKRVPATGKKKPLKPRKDAADFETALASACSQIVHSGDYGMCFYKAGDNADMYTVWWTAGDADDPGNTNEEGNAYSSTDDIKKILSGVTGVETVQIEAESNPPYDEGWREVYPEVRDWVSDANGQKPQDAKPATGNQDGTPPTGTDDGTNDGGNTGKSGKTKKKGKGSKADAPVAGSAEHVSDTLGDAAQAFLAQNGVEVGDSESVAIEATYPDYVIIQVGDDDGSSPVRYFQVNYTVDEAGKASFTGTPQEVELQTNASPKVTATNGSNPNPAVDPNQPTPQAGDPVRAPKWVPKTAAPATKGKVGKKDMGLLKEAQDHIADAMGRDGMPTVCKTLCRRAAECIDTVVKSDGKPDPADGAPADKPAMMNDAERALWVTILKSLKSPHATKMSVAALMSELASRLEATEIARLLSPSP